MPIPVFDLNALESEDAEWALLDAALCRNGVAYFANLGDEYRAARDALRAEAKAFFRAPREHKMAAGTHPTSPFQYKGDRAEISGFYSNVLVDERSEQNLTQEARVKDPLQPDRKESFLAGPTSDIGERLRDSFYSTPTTWPEPSLFPNLRPAVEAYSQAAREVSVRIWGLLERVAGAPQGSLSSDFWEQDITATKINYYLSAVEGHSRAAGADVKVAEHIDADMSTLLAIDPEDTEADQHLEVWNPDTAAWVPVQYVNDAVIFQLGVMVRYKTAGCWKPCWHRVVGAQGDAATANKERLSIVTFFTPHSSRTMRPLEVFTARPGSAALLDGSACEDVADILLTGRLGEAAKQFGVALETSEK